MADEPFCFSLKNSSSFAYLGALQMPHLGGDSIKRARDDRQRGHVVRVPVALDHLRTYRRCLQSQPLADLFFQLRIEVRSALPTAPESLPTRISSAARSKRFESRSTWAYQLANFSPKVMGSAWTPCVRPIMGVCLKFMGAAVEHAPQAVQSFADQGGRGLHLQRLRSVDHIIGSQAEVQPAGFRPDLFRDRCGESQDIVLDFGFELGDALEIEITFAADGLRGVLRHQAGFGENFAGGDLHLQPGAELVFVAPDAAHLRPRVTLDQCSASTPSRNRRF